MARTQRWLKHFYVSVNNSYDMYIDTEGTLSAESDADEFDDRVEFDDHVLDSNSEVDHVLLNDYIKGLLNESSGPNSRSSTDIGSSTNGVLDNNNDSKDSPSSDIGSSSKDFTLPILHEGRINGVLNENSGPNNKLRIDIGSSSNGVLDDNNDSTDSPSSDIGISSKAFSLPILDEGRIRVYAQNYPEMAAKYRQMMHKPTQEQFNYFSNISVMGMQYFRYLLMAYRVNGPLQYTEDTVVNFIFLNEDEKIAEEITTGNNPVL